MALLALLAFFYKFALMLLQMSLSPLTQGLLLNIYNYQERFSYHYHEVISVWGHICVLRLYRVFSMLCV